MDISQIGNEYAELTVQQIVATLSKNLSLDEWRVCGLLIELIERDKTIRFFKPATGLFGSGPHGPIRSKVHHSVVQSEASVTTALRVAIRDERWDRATVKVWDDHESKLYEVQVAEVCVVRKAIEDAIRNKKPAVAIPIDWTLHQLESASARKARLEQLVTEEESKNPRGALARVAKIEGISRQTLSGILKRNRQD